MKKVENNFQTCSTKLVSHLLVDLLKGVAKVCDRLD